MCQQPAVFDDQQSVEHNGLYRTASICFRRSYLAQWQSDARSDLLDAQCALSNSIPSTLRNTLSQRRLYSVASTL